MSDLHLRRLERSAQSGDLSDMAHALNLRIRIGHLPYKHVLYAAHLGDPVACMIEPEAQIIIDCSHCHRIRNDRTSRVRQPTPLRETPRQCFKCRGSQKIKLDKGLIPFVRTVDDVPHRILIAWAADMAERHLEQHKPRAAFHGRYQLPGEVVEPALRREVLPAVRAWLETGEYDPLIYQHAQVNAACNRELSTTVGLATMVALANVENQEAKVRYRAAAIATEGYYAAGGTRIERNWQEDRLIKYLLGYLGSPS